MSRELLSDEAKRQMRLFAERCDGREGKCKSCRFLLRALDEIERLSRPTVKWNARVTASGGHPPPLCRECGRMVAANPGYTYSPVEGHRCLPVDHARKAASGRSQRASTLQPGASTLSTVGTAACAASKTETTP